MTEADAFIALLAYQRCQELADRTTDPTLKKCWQADADAAYERMKNWHDENEKLKLGVDDA
jgi:hypothetical protein